MLTLRPYQEESLEKINENLTKTNKQVLVLATGLGKTVVFSHLIKQRLSLGKALVLAHREELLKQAQDKLARVDPTINSAIEQAQHRANGEDVVIASVATIGRKGSKRLEALNPQEFKTVIIDEAHHASAESYKTVLNHFGLLKTKSDWNKECLLLGVTATPNRADNKGIDQVFDETAYAYGILEGIQDGWLSRIRAWRVDTRTDLGNIHTQAGDFVTSELSDAINNDARNKLVVKTYKEHLDGKQALVFAADIAHARALLEAFQKEKILTEMVDGTTPKDQRSQILDDFHHKRIQIVVNCMVLTEGYDNETIDAILMARPTQSGVLYQQMVGRGTRTHEEKPFLTVVDFVDNTYRHRLKTISSLLGIEGKVKFRGEDILNAKEQLDQLKELSPNLDFDQVSMDRIQYLIEEVDLLAGLTLPKELDEFTNMAWHRYGIDSYKAGLGNHQSIIIEKTLTGQWSVRKETYDVTSKNIHKEILGECQTLEEAINRSDRFIRNRFPDSLRLLALDANWRFDDPTENQLKTLRKLRIDEAVIQSLDKGQASQLITKLFNLKERSYI